jgi:hypothetical protein
MRERHKRAHHPGLQAQTPLESLTGYHGIAQVSPKGDGHVLIIEALTGKGTERISGMDMADLRGRCSKYFVSRYRRMGY